MKHYLVEVRSEVVIVPIEADPKIQPSVGNYMMPKTIKTADYRLYLNLPKQFCIVLDGVTLRTVVLNINPEECS